MVVLRAGKKMPLEDPLDQQQEVLSTAVVTFLRLLFGLKFLDIKNRKEHWITVLSDVTVTLALQQCAASSSFLRPLDIYNLLRILVHIRDIYTSVIGHTFRSFSRFSD